MEISVRRYKPSDKEKLRDICLATSPYAANPTPAKKTAVCALYNDYYTDCEADNCFVAQKENGEVVGYVICSTQPDDYLVAMRKHYTPVAAENRFFAPVEQKATEYLLGKFAKQGYTAHLHIDINDEGRHQGVGRKLMHALCSHFTAKGVKGVMLICGADNKNARAFYERCGFEEKQRFFTASVYVASPAEVVSKIDAPPVLG